MTISKGTSSPTLLPILTSYSSPKISSSSSSSSSSSGQSSPPLQTSTACSVPFLWEEQPGKPLPCTAITTHKKSLELPPRLQQPTEYSRLITKTPSPTTVLDGPYLPKNVISSSSSSSFRKFKSSSKRHVDFFDSGRFISPESGALLLAGDNKGKKGIFGSFRGQIQKSSKLEGTKQEFNGEGSFVFSPSLQFHVDQDEEIDNNKSTSTKIKRNGSFCSVSHAKSHFWTAMCEGIKHAIPWKSRKSKKQVHVV